MTSLPNIEKYFVERVNVGKQLRVMQCFVRDEWKSLLSSGHAGIWHVFLRTL